VVIFGVAGGSVVAVVPGISVIVSPVVISDVVTGPGVGGSAALVLLEATANTPMATPALTPTIAAASLICFEFTFDHPIRSLVDALGAPNSSRGIDSRPSSYSTNRRDGR
jgi:hypothetical protein